MNRSLVFDSPFLLGFDHTRSLIERAAKAAAESYPPYNVEDRGEGALRITLAVAGFTPDQLQVTVEERQLVIAGKREGAADEAYLHRGIAARDFERRFQLADYIEVGEAGFDNGLLWIELKRVVPEAMKPRKIAIGSGNSTPDRIASRDEKALESA